MVYSYKYTLPYRLVNVCAELPMWCVYCRTVSFVNRLVFTLYVLYEGGVSLYGDSDVAKGGLGV